MRYILLLLLPCLVHTISAQITEKADYGTFALTNAQLYTVTQGVQQGNLIIQDGKITAVGPDAKVPASATVIDCSGKRVYPGFIDSGTQLGLIEIGSISLTQDANEIGSVVPHMQALTAINPNAVAIPVTRVWGITSVIANPSGGIFPGTAALVHLYGYTPDDMYAGFKGVRMNFPVTGKRGRWDRRSAEDRKKQEEKQLKQLNDTWEDAIMFEQIERNAKSDNNIQIEFNPAMRALAPVVRGEQTLMIEVNRQSDILSAIKWVQDKDLNNVVFTGVQEGWRVAQAIAEANIPVITGPVIDYPTRNSDRYDAAYANAGKLHAAGVRVALRSNNSENVRNLPFHAGFAVAYGLPAEAALRAVTIEPATMFGVGDQLGSLEIGKTASLFIADGDPFETATRIEQVFINGWKIPMTNRHRQLYEEFLERE